MGRDDQVVLDMMRPTDLDRDALRELVLQHEKDCNTFVLEWDFVMVYDAFDGYVYNSPSKCFGEAPVEDDAEDTEDFAYPWDVVDLPS
jgi:hypothetical protein